MYAFLDETRWAEVFKGFEMVGVAIRDKGILQFCSRKKLPQAEASLLMDYEIPVRIVSLFLERAVGDNCGYQEMTGMAYPVLGVSRSPFERPGGMIASKNDDGDTWPVGGGNGPMEQILTGGSPFPKRLKCLFGFTYSVGYPREIHKRVAVGRWERVGDIPCPASAIKGAGFNDLDAFAPTDMYAVGGHGDVWHFDGTAWKQMGFPSNVQLGTVTCAGDGNVYISGEGGSLWVGSKSTWTRVYEGSSSILWNDVLWFKGQLWLASDYQFRIWDGKEMQAVTYEGKSVSMYGHMDVYDGLLAIASPEWVKTFDGKEWRTIVAPYLT
jgi:hypothetical protein